MKRRLVYCLLALAFAHGSSTRRLLILAPRSKEALSQMNKFMEGSGSYRTGEVKGLLFSDKGTYAGTKGANGPGSPERFLWKKMSANVKDIVGHINSSRFKEVLVLQDKLDEHTGGKLGEILKDVNRSINVYTVINTVTAPTIQRALVARGIGTHSSYVIVDSAKERAALANGHGLVSAKIKVLPVRKIFASTGSEAGPDSWGALEKLMGENIYLAPLLEEGRLQAEKHVKKKRSGGVGGAIVRKFGGEKKRMGNGLFVLYSDPYVHVNGYFSKSTLESLSVRISKERQSYKHFGGVRGRGKERKHLIPRRGKSNEMLEEYIFVRRDGTMKFLKEDLRDLVKYSRTHLLLRTPNIDVSIKLKGGKLRARFIRRNAVGRAYGLIGSSLHPSGHKRHRAEEEWRLEEDGNFFKIAHSRLMSSADGTEGHIYKHSRLRYRECFDGKRDTSQMKRLVIVGRFNSSGIGHVNRRMVLGMKRFQNVFVFARPIYSKWTRMDPEDFDDYLVKVHMAETGQGTQGLAMSSIREISGIKVKPIEFRNIYPMILSPSTAGFVTIVQFPWEFSEVPMKWVNALKRIGAYVWAPSRYCVKVHGNAGIPRDKLKLVPHGVDSAGARIFLRTASKGAGRGQKIIKFLAVGGLLERKGMDVAVNAYLKAFKKGDPVMLRIHSMYGDTPVLAKIRQLIRQNEGRGPKIVFTYGILPPNSIKLMMARSHFLVSPHRGEGFGLPILEAMAYGTVPIVTNYASAQDICSKANAFFVPCKEVSCTKDPVKLSRGAYTIFGLPLKRCPKWAEPSVEALARIMKRAFRMARKKSKLYRAMSKRCKAAARKKDWRVQMRRIKKLLPVRK